MTSSGKTKLQEFDDEHARSPVRANRLLFTWLSDDKARTKLYEEFRNGPRVLKFQSRADKKERPTQDVDSNFRQNVYLLTSRQDVEKALKELSNEPYKALGAGTFMLGLDKGKAHDAQLDFAGVCLRYSPEVISALSTVAFRAAAVLPLKQRRFDLADLAEQAALRFVGFLFGFAQADHALLETTMRAAYRGLNNRIIGRHFVSELGNIIATNAAMAELLRRVAELLGLYRARISQDDEDECKRLKSELEEIQTFRDGPDLPLKAFTPALRRIAAPESPAIDANFSGTELAVIVVGLIAGTVGNVQAGVCNAINEFFERGLVDSARDAAEKAWLGDPSGDKKLTAMVWEALRLSPPAAFLPRKVNQEGAKLEFSGKKTLLEGRNVILAMGAATRDGLKDPDGFDDTREPHPLIFGGPLDGGGYLHQCVGQKLAMPLIVRIVRQVLLLDPARTLDPRTGEPTPLEKIWGVICKSFPLEFDRGALLTQSPLIVIMRVKQPIAVHAEALKAVIKYGAPRIEKKLNDAEHVHFASFLFIENDTKLMLMTVYDRDFDSYIEHFALKIGPLFDRIFEHIEDAPPLPVDEFPKEFVDTIRRYNARPAGGYFYSAYPNANVARIVQTFPREDP